MTRTTCDLCNTEIKAYPIRVEFRDGEHPHNGSTMYKTVDLCQECATSIDGLKCHEEWDDFKKSIYAKQAS